MASLCFFAANDPHHAAQQGDAHPGQAEGFQRATDAAEWDGERLLDEAESYFWVSWATLGPTEAGLVEIGTNADLLSFALELVGALLVGTVHGSLIGRMRGFLVKQLAITLVLLSGYGALDGVAVAGKRTTGTAPVGFLALGGIGVFFTKFLLGLFFFGAIGVGGGAFAVFARSAATAAAAIANGGVCRDTDASCVAALNAARGALAVVAGLAIAVGVGVFLGHTYASRVFAGSLSSWAWVFVRDADARGVFAGGAASGAFVFVGDAHTGCILTGRASRRTATRWGLVVAFVACEFGVGQIATGNALCTPAAGHRARHGAATGKTSCAGISDHAPQRAWGLGTVICGDRQAQGLARHLTANAVRFALAQAICVGLFFGASRA